VLPFACLLATAGLRSMVTGFRTASGTPLLPALVGVALAYGFAQDIAHWRLPRSNREIHQLLRLMPESPPDRTLVVEQLWRVGGHLYLDDRPVVDLTPDAAGSASELARSLATRSCLLIDKRTFSSNWAINAFLQSRNASALPVAASDPYVGWLV